MRELLFTCAVVPRGALAAVTTCWTGPVGQIDVLTPGFSSVRPPQGHCDDNCAEQQNCQRQWVVVHRQQTKTEARDEQGPLQFDVMPSQPGIRLHLDDFGSLPAWVVDAADPVFTLAERQKPVGRRVARAHG